MKNTGVPGCHAPDGTGGIRNYNYVNGTEPNLRKTVPTYTKDELVEKIKQRGLSRRIKPIPKGPRPALYMPPGKTKSRAKRWTTWSAIYLVSRKSKKSGRIGSNGL
jgi:hypothetical protein